MKWGWKIVINVRVPRTELLPRRAAARQALRQTSAVNVIFIRSFRVRMSRAFGRREHSGSRFRESSGGHGGVRLNFGHAPRRRTVCPGDYPFMRQFHAAYIAVIGVVDLIRIRADDRRDVAQLDEPAVRSADRRTTSLWFGPARTLQEHRHPYHPRWSEETPRAIGEEPA